MSQQRFKGAFAKSRLPAIGSVLIMATIVLPWVSIIHPLSILPHLAVWNIFNIALSAPAGSGLQDVAGIILFGMILVFPGSAEMILDSFALGIAFTILGLLIITWVVSSTSPIVSYDTGYYLAWVGTLLAIIGRVRTKFARRDVARSVSNVDTGRSTNKQANFRCDCGRLFQTTEEARNHLQSERSHKIQRIGYEAR